MPARVSPLVLDFNDVLAWACEHKDRPMHAKGFCGICYQRRYRHGDGNIGGDPDRLRRADLILIPQPQKFCSLCGEGMYRDARECQLHPDICNACENEYCEHNANVELKPLEEILLLPEEKQVPYLRARKMTLKLAGKHASAMPKAEINQQEAVAYIHITKGGWQEDDPWLEVAIDQLENINEDR